MYKLAVGIFLAFATGSAALAGEGMWTPDNLPTAQLQAKYGFTPTAEWTAHAQHAALRLAGGCSGSFVSPKGLVLTNHHCVNSCVQQLSTADRDFIKSGFLASVPFLAAFIGVLCSGVLSDFLIRRGATVGLARKLPIILGLLISTSMIGANFTDSTPWVIFFLALAALNEAVWRNLSTDLWVDFKVWVILPLILLFALAQTPLVLRHGQDSNGKS